VPEEGAREAEVVVVERVQVDMAEEKAKVAA